MALARKALRAWWHGLGGQHPLWLDFVLPLGDAEGPRVRREEVDGTEGKILTID
jgi:hypothetical protein